MKQNSYLSNSFRKIYGLFQKKMFLRKFKSLMFYLDFFLLLFIKKSKYIDGNKKKVLIVYNMAFGDGVIWRCTSIQLNKLYPKERYELTLVCQKGIDKLYENDKTYDNIIALDFTKATINLKERIKNFRKIRSKYYDIIIDPVGIVECTTNVLITRSSLGIKKIGLIDQTSRIYCSNKIIKHVYDEIIKIDGKKLSLIDFYATFIKELSAGSLNFEVGLEKINTNLTNIQLPEKYFIIFPSASMQLKRWSMEKYARLAEKIYEKSEMKLVLVGTSADKEAIDEFKNKVKISYIDLVEKTNLNDYINIIKNASLVVTNDTSAYHIAVVEETPVAIITGGYTYDRYVEYNFKRMNEFKQPCIIVHQMDCFNCGNRCPYLKSGDTNWPCLEKITVDYAWAKIEKLIADNGIGE